MWHAGPGTSGAGAIQSTAAQVRGRAIAGRRIGAVGVLAAFMFAATFAIGAATKTHTGVQQVAQPAPATSVFTSTPARITAGLASPAVPALKRPPVRKHRIVTAPVQAAPAVPGTTVVPTAPTHVQPSGPSQPPNSGFGGSGPASNSGGFGGSGPSSP